jgi:anti-sigma B factor antagonist
VTRVELTETFEVGAKILHVDGEVDLSNSARLRTDIERLASHGAGRLIVDLSACTYIESTGLAALLHGSGRTRDFAIVARDGAPREMLQTTAIDQTVPVFETVESARPAGSPVS